MKRVSNQASVVWSKANLGEWSTTLQLCLGGLVIPDLSKMNGKEVVPSNRKNGWSFQMIQVYVYNSSRDMSTIHPGTGAFLHFWLLDTFGSSGPVILMRTWRHDKVSQAALDQKHQGQRGWTAAPPSRAFHFLSPITKSNDTNPGADRIKNAQQIPKLLQLRVRWDPSAGKLLRHQHSLPGALDRNFRSWVFLKWGPNKNPPWTISLPLLGNATVWGLGCLPVFWDIPKVHQQPWPSLTVSDLSP